MASNDRNRTIYQRLAPVYDLAARVPLIAHPRTRLFTVAGIQPGQRVLVVGVGTGQDLAHLPAGTEVTGIDLSPAMLARARALGTDATLQEMNAEHLGFPDYSFDVVLLSYVLSVVGDPPGHWPKPPAYWLPRAAFGSWASSTKPHPGPPAGPPATS